jgi:hypothetical protein
MLAMMAVPALAAHVELEDRGGPRVEDKREYRTLLVLGPRFVPPGIGGRVTHLLDDHVGVMVGAGYSGWQILGLELRHVDLRAGIDLEPLGNGLDGPYLGARGVYKTFLGSVDVNDQPTGLSTETMTFGGVAGWRFVVHPGFSVGAALGAGYTTWVGEAGHLDGGDDVTAVGLTPMGEFALGWAF